MKEACFPDRMCSPRGWKISRSVNKLRGRGRKRENSRYAEKRKDKKCKVGPTEQVVGKFKILYKHLIYMSIIDFDMGGITVTH